MLTKFILILAVLTASTGAIAADTANDPYQEQEAECPCQRYGQCPSA